MLVGIQILLLVSNTFAQMDGEFWWLNDKVAKLTGVKAPQPYFEELTEFDTDDTAKITFRDDGLFPTNNNFDETNSVINENINKFESNSLETAGIVFPGETFKKPRMSNNANQLFNYINRETTTSKIKSAKKQGSGDVFIFKYPDDDNIIVKDSVESQVQEESARYNISDKPMPRQGETKSEKTTENSITKRENTNLDVLTFKFPDDNILVSKNFSESSKESAILHNNQSKVLMDTNNKIINTLHNDTIFTESKESSLSENICSFIKKSECNQRNGIVYNSEKVSAIKTIRNARLICCIVPLSTIDSRRIVFPDASEVTKRFRRSNKEETTNRSLRQREFLLEHKFRTPSIKPTVSTRVVTPEDEDYYVDPYLNVKGVSMKKTNTQHGPSKQDYNYPDYVEDYIVELPRPGLVGLYSDNGQRQPWSVLSESRPSYGTNVDESEEYDEPSFGYSTVDPRGCKGTYKTPKRGRPFKLTTSLPEAGNYDIDSYTVSFQSTPNFQVLQGFKLPNLGRTKNKFYTKGNRRSTTEGSVESDSTEPEENAFHLSLFGNQVYENCGKTRKLHDNERNDKHSGEAENGSHPWMALVVSTRRPQGILCYATIVHPRAAVTAGDCVYERTSSKEVILIAGLWNLSDRTRIQNRIVTVQMHPQYRSKALAHDLALLHWITPLRLNANIQPACLASVNPRDAGDCQFFGWGGFDQGIRTRSRWQRASVISKQECAGRLSKAVSLPDDAFCVTVQTRGTVTGVGGPLMCNINGRKTSLGVAIWRDNALVLIPAHEWIIRAFQDLDIQ